MIAKLAVSDCVYAIDRPYSYRIPEGISVLPGMRVLVPFGNGNRRKEAVVLAVSEEPAEGLKWIESVLDEEPVLAPSQLRLAGFLRERYFCTYYDAVKAILPAGVWFRRQETFALTEKGTAAALLASAQADQSLPQGAAAELISFLQDLGGSAPEKTLRQRFPQETELQTAIKTLKAKKLLTSSLELSVRGSTKSQKFAMLAVSAEEAQDFARRKQKSAPLQAAALSLLCTVGSAGVQELCDLTGASAATLRRLEKLGLIATWEEEVYRRPVLQYAGDVRTDTRTAASMTALTDEQQTAVDGLWAQAQQEKPGAALLYGVTGSGKTAVYLALIERTLQMGRGAILLVPEIALTPQLLGKLAARFGEQVAILHSSLQVGQRYDEWRRIREGKASVVVGTRSAVFAPLENLGLLILDEEQEHTYKSENTPRYHAREVALYRGATTGALVLFGSATPSIETMYHARRGDLTLYLLRERFNRRSLPKVELVDMKQELRAGNAGTVSSALEERLRDTVLAGQQAILFLNRRGNSRCLVCVDCGDAPSCPRCSVYLTYHSATQRLLCHYCGYSEPVTQRCPHCGGALRPVGAGTQKVEEELHAVFPDTTLLRMDADTVSAANSHEVILERFRRKEASFLLGTQMVAKGLDFPSVTLAAVLDADMGLYVNSYRAAETTFSLVTQLVGRSGRGETAGTALIQTMSPEHPVLKLAAAQDYDGFYDIEIALRELRGVPPFCDLLTVTFTGLFEEQVRAAAKRFREALAMNLRQSPYAGMEFDLLGPAPAAVAKVNYTYRYRLTLRCKNGKQIRALLSFLLCVFAKDKQNKGVNAFVDVNPYD